ncbi:3-hydroxyacyl-CoA dehydrogenase family protein, partial [candidate division KSB1 bacterium]|nr:3-hydroxyacyl-CoA dehydrogenase family protein [candidate division KSB1 bacterium]
MKLDQRLTNVSVIGAAGKMGSGIALLMAHEMYLQKMNPQNAGKPFRLNLIDVNEEALDGLIEYLRSQSVKKGEKSIVMLRNIYANDSGLVENTEIIQKYVDGVMAIIRASTDMRMAEKSHLVFEAVVENIDLKIELFGKLNKLCGENTYFFTNTSSIPIHLLNNGAGLNGRIIGFHFYNPPAVQKLAEIIPARETRSDLKEMALEIGKRLGKKIYLSADVAGFIGNGHFLRDALHAISEVRRLQKEHSMSEAIYIINKVSQDLLVRPMGIFQLMDYVGVDVMHFISKIMNKYIDGEDLSDELIDSMYQKKVMGGQRSDGSQKDGFFKYERNRPVAVYDPENDNYVAFNENGFSEKLDRKIGDYPENWTPWKGLLT